MIRDLLGNSAFLRRFYYHCTSDMPYRRLRADRAALQAAIDTNRATLAQVSRWLEGNVRAGSIFQYGMPDQIYAHIDRPLGNSATYADLLVYLARERASDLRYLELGPSVGKTLLQISKAVTNARLCAIDIEDINPVLAGFFDAHDSIKFPLGSSSMRQRPGLDSHFVDRECGNSLRYIAGDLFESATWDRLSGEQFNLVFSDAFHSPGALLTEWQNLRGRKLLDPEGFVMVWDDLASSPMRAAFNQISREMATDFGESRVTASLELFDGWVGRHERPHPTGIVTCVQHRGTTSRR